MSRKRVEPKAARVDPLHASARHQSLHPFVAKAERSDEELLRRVAQWAVPKMALSGGACWIIDDTGFPKKGKHAVGVARQYCGVLGKQDSCQVAVSVSLASEQASLPVAYRLYVPYGGKGRPPVVPRRTRARQPVSVNDLAHARPASAFQTISGREGSNETLSGRFAAVRVHYAGGNMARLHPEQ
ncbi:MAG: hypothetical protein AMXMBFR6_08360 [Betaproteobacteria bacterium]